MSGIIKVKPSPSDSSELHYDISSPWWEQLPFFSAYAQRQITAVLTFIYTIILIFGLIALSKGEAAFVQWATIQSHGLTLSFALIVFTATFYYMARCFLGMPMDTKPSADQKIQTTGVKYWITFFFALVIIMALAGLN